MFKLFLATSVCAIGFVSTAIAQVQCDMPYPGEWLVETEGTVTPAGRNSPETQLFQLTVEECGQVIVTTGFGAPETGETKVFSRDDNQFHFETFFQNYPITNDIWMMEDPTRMTLLNTFNGGQASTRATLTYQGPAGLLEIDPRCDCQPFIDQLNEAIESNDFFIALYPDLSERPSDLDPSLPWQADISEALVDLQASLGVTRSEAVKILNDMPGGRDRASEDKIEAEIQRRQSAKPTDDEPSGRSDVSSDANTDATTCEIEVTQPAAGCAADILDGANLAHENVHRTACLAQNRLKNDWNFVESAEEQPLSYRIVSDQPDVLAAEEVRAYMASNSHIRTTYARICGKPLN